MKLLICFRLRELNNGRIISAPTYAKHIILKKATGAEKCYHIFLHCRETARGGSPPRTPRIVNSLLMISL